MGRLRRLAGESGRIAIARGANGGAWAQNGIKTACNIGTLRFAKALTRGELACGFGQRMVQSQPATLRLEFARGASTGACAVDMLLYWQCTENGTSNAMLASYSQFVNRKRALLSSHYLNKEQLN